MKNYLKGFKNFNAINENEMYDGEETYDDEFTGDLDQAGDGIVTLDSLAMNEFGMLYNQLGPDEQEWCNDKYDELA
jgi:hypothetical protein